jgi:hypothetical protein
MHTPPRLPACRRKALAGLLDGDLLEAVEIAHDVAPFRIGTGSGKPLTPTGCSSPRRSPTCSWFAID